jgi:hypothetical protein
MALATDGVDITAGVGTTIATQLIGSKEYQVVVLASEVGQVQGSAPTYSFYIKTSAGAAAKIHFDLFNASGSSQSIVMSGLWISPQLSGTAVTGTASPDFDFYRTNSIGTGGTAVTAGSATFPSIALMDTTNTPSLPVAVTMRAGPTAGAASLHALFTTYVTQEETQAGAQLGQFYNVMPAPSFEAQRYVARPGQGFKLVQTTLGVAQNYSIFGVFTLV